MPAARNCGGVGLHKGAGAPDLEAAAQRAMTERVAFAAQRGLPAEGTQDGSLVLEGLVSSWETGS